MSNSSGSLAGTIIGVGLGLFALNQISKYSNGSNAHSRCKYCGVYSNKEHRAEKVYCKNCSRRLQ